jgi:hypothetical protein
MSKEIVFWIRKWSWQKRTSHWKHFISEFLKTWEHFCGKGGDSGERYLRAALCLESSPHTPWGDRFSWTRLGVGMITDQVHCWGQALRLSSTTGLSELVQHSKWGRCTRYPYQHHVTSCAPRHREELAHGHKLRSGRARSQTQRPGPQFFLLATVLEHLSPLCTTSLLRASPAGGK